MTIHRNKSGLTLGLVVPLLASCAATSNYADPQSNRAVETYGTFFKRANGEAIPAPPPARWWEQLNDPILTKLIDDGLDRSPDVRIAIARVTRARAAAAEQQANLKPSLGGSAIAAEANFSGPNPLTGGGQGGGSSSSDLNFYNIGLSASWELDLFGGRKNAAEGAIAEAQAMQADLSDVRVALAAQIAIAYIELRNWQHQQALLQEMVSLQEEALRLEEVRVRLGTASEVGLSTARGKVAASRAELAATIGEKLAATDRAALLMGAVAGSLDEILGTIRPIPLPPREVSIGDPAGLLQRRPDIRAAERRLAAANARIGVANAQRFPSVSFFGLLGLGGSDPGDVLDIGKLSTILLPRINWTFLDFGRAKARVDQAKAGANEAAANYDRVVLTALTDAEQSLSRFGGQRQRVFQLTEAHDAAANGEALAQARFRRGTTSRISAIDASLQKLQAERATAMATSDMTKAYVAIQKSLGLGWSNPG